jgi:hypothetical protein
MSEGRLLLLVLASSSLKSRPRAEAWVHRMLAACFEEIPEDSVVLTGGAPGPETWTCEAAESNGLRWVVYLQDGRRLDSTDEGATERRWAPGQVGPEEQARALVGALKKSKQAGWQVRVLSLAEREGEVPGAEATLRHARKEGFPVEQAVIEG